MRCVWMLVIGFARDIRRARRLCGEVRLVVSLKTIEAR